MTQEEIKYHNQLWYYKTYNQLIDKCIQLESDGYPEDMYTEVHHILPKCMGGTNKEDNLVRMPVRYHIMAHLLLVKIYPNIGKIIYAANIMIVGNKNTRAERNLALNQFSTKTISQLRETMANYQKGKPLSEEHKQKISFALKGKVHSEDHNRKVSESKKGKHLSKETKDKLKLSHLGKSLSESHKKAIGNALRGRKGKPLSEEVREKISKNNKISKAVQDYNGVIYNSISDCSRKLNIPDSTISYWIKKHPEKGFKFV